MMQVLIRRVASAIALVCLLFVAVGAETARAQFMELRTPFERFTDWRLLLSASAATPPNSEWSENARASLSLNKKQLTFNQGLAVEYGEFRVGVNSYDFPSVAYPYVIWNPKFSLMGWNVGGDTNRWGLSLRGENLFATGTANEFQGKGQSDKSNFPDRNSFSFLFSYWLGSEMDSLEQQRLYQEAYYYEGALREDVYATNTGSEVRFSRRDGLSVALGLGTGKYAGSGPISKYLNFLSYYDVLQKDGFTGINPLIAIRYRVRNFITQFDIAGEDVNLHFILRNLRQLDIETGVIHLEHLFPRYSRGPHRPEAYLTLRYAFNSTDSTALDASFHEYGDAVLSPGTDSDGDGILDGDEVLAFGTNPNANDTDADGLTDGDEVRNRKTDPIKYDTDGDGIGDGDEVNRYKTSPRTNDTDGDGLTDGEELTVYMTKPLVRDSDGDGLNDGDEVAAGVNPNQRDSDGDGLSDGEEVINYKTSPKMQDTDGDDLTDYVEVYDTKTQPLKVDTDDDGVTDNDDDCPLTYGDASNNGCPPQLAAGQQLDVAGIEFETGSATILEISTPSLMRADSIMRQYPTLRVSIEGHTDNMGTPELNKRLSLDRANAVRDWLITRGIAADRIQTKGYGQDSPVSTNSTEEGRALNRRIEFRVIEN
jgi:outer membrane protein OmpA-like peptidoglycan-associated protein